MLIKLIVRVRRALMTYPQQSYDVSVHVYTYTKGVTGNILKFADDTKLFRTLRKLGINKNYKMTLINLSGGLKNGRCYSDNSILGNVNVYTQGL